MKRFAISLINSLLFGSAVRVTVQVYMMLTFLSINDGERVLNAADYNDSAKGLALLLLLQPNFSNDQ